ncbi:MAG: hypothetical protein AMJ84_02125 [Acidithiobacillales bacterium SM23_46]|nr:MAG: hypothetical protein AMJ84_02125 [Acidithiobacillales bacterium SM23_46]
MRKGIVLAILFVVVASVGFASPRILTYQGSLLRPGGAAPVSNGTYDMRFSIYDVASGGASLWTETDAAVQVTGSLFNTVLCDGTAFSRTFSPWHYDLWLEVEIDVDGNASFDGDELFSPRQRLTASPWAMDADRLNGRDASQFLSSAMPLTLEVSSGSTAIQFTNYADIRNVQDLYFRDPATANDIYLYGGDINEAGNVTADSYRYGTDPVYHRKYSSMELVTLIDNPTDRVHRHESYGYSYMFSGTGPHYNSKLGTAVRLPHGAKIEEMVAVVYDNDNAGSIDVQLWRFSASGSRTDMAQVKTVHAGTSLAVQSLADSTIDCPYVDNSTYSYVLCVWFDASAPGADKIRFYNVRLRFTMPTVAP